MPSTDQALSLYRGLHTWKLTTVINGARYTGDTSPNIDDLLPNIDYTLLCLTWESCAMLSRSVIEVYELT
jgi:hypothetical protein